MSSTKISTILYTVSAVVTVPAAAATATTTTTTTGQPT